MGQPQVQGRAICLFISSSPKSALTVQTKSAFALVAPTGPVLSSALWLQIPSPEVRGPGVAACSTPRWASRRGWATPTERHLATAWAAGTPQLPGRDGAVRRSDFPDHSGRGVFPSLSKLSCPDMALKSSFLFHVQEGHVTGGRDQGGLGTAVMTAFSFSDLKPANLFSREVLAFLSLIPKI